MDADLSILGAGEEVYMDYAHRIRKEYKHVEDEIYNVKRPIILQKLIDSKPFKTAYFHNLYHEKAKVNVQAEIEMLTLLNDFNS